MTPYWQNIMALTAVAVAAAALAIRCGIFRHGRKDPKNNACRSCSDCRPHDCDKPPGKE